MRVLDDWLLTPERVAVHMPSGTAVVADLHLGYAEARRRDGEAVPADDLAAALSVLGRVLTRHAARRLVVAGDLLENDRCRSALDAFCGWLDTAGVELAGVVPGNHDRALGKLLGAGRVHPEGVRLGRWHVVHGDGPLPEGPLVQGHEHPHLRWSPATRAPRPRVFGGRGGVSLVDAPCYLVGGERLILPAFSAEAAGANVLSDRRWRAFRCCAVAADRVLDLGPLASLRRRLSAAT